MIEYSTKKKWIIIEEILWMLLVQWEKVKLKRGLNKERALEGGKRSCGSILFFSSTLSLRMPSHFYPLAPTQQ